LDVAAGRRLSGLGEVSERITIGRSPDEVFRFFRDLRNWPRFLAATGSLDDVALLDERAGESLVWRSRSSSGCAWFVAAPGGRGTEVHLALSGAPIGERLSRDSLRRLKQLIETGEVTDSDASLYATPHPARPPVLPARKEDRP